MARPIIPETADQEIATIQTEVKAELPTSNPWLKYGNMRAEIIGFGKRVFAFYYHLRAMFDMFFPGTSRGPWRDMWAAFRNISPVSASSATGYVTATGVAGSSIAAGKVLKVGTNDYNVVSTVSVTANTIYILSITRSGTTATCTTDGDHELGSGMSVTIAGATESDWNDTFSSIVVTDTDEFTFQVASTYPSTSSGTPYIDIDSISVNVSSDATGLETNQDSGVQMEFDSTPVGVDDIAYVQFGGITGGADADNQDDPNSDYNRRINEAFGTIESPANPDEIKRVVMAVDKANTRVWVHRLWNNDTMAEEPGCTSIFFVRDGDDDIIPSSAQVALVKAAVMERYDASTDEDDIFVNDDLTAVPIDVAVNSVTPATTSMRLAVAAQIDSFFRNFNDEGIDLNSDKLSGFIYQTWDSDAGEKIQNFEMISPSGINIIPVGSIPTKGTVTVS